MGTVGEISFPRRTSRTDITVGDGDGYVPDAVIAMRCVMMSTLFFASGSALK